MKIFVTREGKQEGPYSLGQINAFINFGWVKPEDNAWYDGCPNWVHVRDIPGVAGLSNQLQVAVTRKMHYAASPSRKSLKCKVCDTGYLVKKRMSRYSPSLNTFGKILLTADIVALVGFIVWLIISSKDNDEAYQIFVRTLDLTSANLLVMSWIGLLIIGFVLKSKKRVLQCSQCESVINIS